MFVGPLFVSVSAAIFPVSPILLFCFAHNRSNFAAEICDEDDEEISFCMDGSGCDADELPGKRWQSG